VISDDETEVHLFKCYNTSVFHTSAITDIDIRSALYSGIDGALGMINR